jgi:hypothetical protein
MNINSSKQHEIPDLWTYDIYTEFVQNIKIIKNMATMQNWFAIRKCNVVRDC